MTTKVKLTANVNPSRVGGKVGFVTHVMIMTGNLIVATAKLTGRYTSEQAVAEFVKNPKRFQFAPKFANLTPELIRTLAA